MYLTLPLPITKTWRHLVHYVPWDPTKRQLAVQIEVPKDSSYGYLKKLFGRWFDADPEHVSRYCPLFHRRRPTFCLAACG